MTLYVDIGSSRLKVIEDNGGFGNEIAFSYELETLAKRLPTALGNFPEPGRILVANVAGQAVAEIFQNSCLNAWSISPEFLSVKAEWGGIKNAYDDPSQLGIDRWLVMIAAWNLYKTDICVVDCGTAITADMVTQEGRHLGGYIIPGHDVMNDSLISHTALKQYSPSSARSLNPGKSTMECMANGTLLAIKSFLEQVINNLYEEHGRKFSCIMTGGASEMIREQLEIDTHYERYLLFTGMKQVAGD